MRYQTNQRGREDLQARASGAIAETKLLDAEDVKDVTQFSVPDECSLEQDIIIGKFLQGSIVLSVSEEPIED
jgi:hypothetical protein